LFVLSKTTGRSPRLQSAETFFEGFEEDNSVDYHSMFSTPAQRTTTLWLRLSPAGYTSPVKNPVLRAESVGWNHLPLPGAV